MHEPASILQCLYSWACINISWSLQSTNNSLFIYKHVNLYWNGWRNKIIIVTFTISFFVLNKLLNDKGVVILILTIIQAEIVYIICGIRCVAHESTHPVISLIRQVILGGNCKILIISVVNWETETFCETETFHNGQPSRDGVQINFEGTNSKAWLLKGNVDRIWKLWNNVSTWRYMLHFLLEYCRPNCFCYNIYFQLGGIYTLHSHPMLN